MKRHSSVASLALAVVVILGLTGPLPADEQVPFKGSLEGLDTAVGANPPFVYVEVTATGYATHLGMFTYVAQQTVDTRTRIATGTFLFTAANGDTVFGTVSGKATLTAPGILTIVEQAIITGGTGRFEDATGNFSLTRLKNTATGATAGTFTGTISDDQDDGRDE